MVNRFIPFATIVITILVVVSSASAFVVIESGPLNGTEIESAQIYRKGDNWNFLFAPISGKLVNDTAFDVSGNIAFVVDLAKRDFWSKIIALRDLGAIAVIHVTNDAIPGREFCIYSGQDAEDIQIEVASVNIKAFTPIIDQVNNGSDIFITLTSQGNRWSVIIYHLAAIIVSRVVFGATILGLLGYSLYKLIVYIKAQGSHFNVPQVCLALEFIANICKPRSDLDVKPDRQKRRIFSLLIDPLGCFQQLPTAFSLWVNAAALPFGTATFVLVTFYWHEIITDSSIKIHPFLSRLKIPFFVITLTLIAADIIVIITGYYLDFGATLPITIIYLIISTGFLIFYIVTAIRIGSRMKAAQKLKRVKRLSRVNSKMILNAVARFCLIITAIAFAIEDDEPKAYLISCFFLASAMLFDSFARIFLFDMPQKVSTSRSPTNSSDKPTTAAGDETTHVQL